MRFLIVDDSSTMRRIIINTLNKLGYKECHEAANGREGVERLATTQVDIVITDWNMPEMNGMELLEELKARDIRVPFGFVTAEGTPEMRRLAAQAGARFVVVKPFTADTLKSKIDAVFAA